MFITLLTIVVCSKPRMFFLSVFIAKNEGNAATTFGSAALPPPSNTTDLGRHFGDGKRTAGAQQRRGQCGMSRAEVVSWRGQVEEAMQDSSSSSYPGHCRDTYIPQLDGRYRYYVACAVLPVSWELDCHKTGVQIENFEMQVYTELIS